MKQDEPQLLGWKTTAATENLEAKSALACSLAATVRRQDSRRRPAPPEALREVARLYRGCELSLSPILVALVSAGTEGLRLSSSSFRHEMCQAVAETIFNDASSRQRMEQFWHHLQQEQKS